MLHGLPRNSTATATRYFTISGQLHTVTPWLHPVLSDREMLRPKQAQRWQKCTLNSETESIRLPENPIQCLLLPSETMKKSILVETRCIDGHPSTLYSCILRGKLRLFYLNAQLLACPISGCKCLRHG